MIELSTAAGKYHDDAVAIIDRGLEALTNKWIQA